MRLLLTLALSAGLVGPALAQEITTTLGREIEAVPVRLERAESFLQAGGESVTATDLVIVSVEVVNLVPFLPRGAEPPLFVVGDVIARQIVSPLLGGRALLLAPAPPPGVTLTVGLLPSGLNLAAVREMPKDALQRERTALTNVLSVTPVAAEPLRFPDVKTLRDRFTATRGRIE